MNENQVKPLDNIRVIDLTHVLAGPYCTYQLGLLGADVIKVEAPRGDMTRGWGGTPEQVKLGLGTGFAAQNAGKKSIVVDITRDSGQEVVRALVKSADVFVENYRPGTMARHGLDYETLKALNQKLIYLSISAFGQNGPHGHRPGFDDVIQATSGFMSINQRGDGPIRTGGPVLDYSTGLHACSSVMAALLLRLQTGEGQRVDIAMQDVTMLLMNRHTSIAASTDELVPPGQNHDGFLLGRYATKDGHVMLAGYFNKHQNGILDAVGLSHYAALSSQEKQSRAEEIEIDVEQVLLERSSSEWDEVFSREGVLGGGVRDLHEVLKTGQPDARGLLTEVESDAGSYQVTTAGYRINDEVFKPQSRVPRCGENTRAVLTDHGYSTEDIERLLSEGSVA
ncbi:MAG: CoA transferase [Pseudomonadales bacterium]|jgi:crotonobetainyl-CoA:carnitine CoA-transferase CaiB-like acyl-CoA transferase